MFAEPPPTRAEPSEYSKLKDSKTTPVRQGDYDVFGDGIVILKYAPGHTEGHQMLFLRLKNSGPVLLAGDLWHYPEERTLDRVPPSDSDPKQTRETRRGVDDFLKVTGATLWIQHDLSTFEKLKRAPQYID
jgi:glyoxylase-like metal-dependent hydrolase (beta-lactamase superfamily II)